MKRFVPLVAFCAVFALAIVPVVSSSANAQRRIIGAGDEPTDAGPPPAADAGPGKKDDKKKKDEKKPEEKKPEEKKADEKKPEDKKADPAATKKDEKKKDDKRDVLEDTPTEKAVKSKDSEAKDAAEKKAEEAAEAEKKKKEEEKKKLEEAKKASDAKKKLENKDQRLAAARKIRQITRTSGAFAISVAIEPGHVVKDNVLEVRVDIAQKLEVPDPKFGSLMPIRNADLVAVVTGGKAKLRYAVHPLETPGRYGFHTTLTKDGVVQVTITGTTKDNKSFDATFPLHVGVWPPPDFEDEEKNNIATTDASRGGRKVLGGNE